MKTYIVVYSDETLVGNQCEQLEINAPNLEMAYELANSTFPDIMIDQIYPA